MLYIMKEGLTLTEAQQTLQTKIDEVTQKIKDLAIPLKKEGDDVKANQKQIDDYTEELRILNDKLKNVINTHKSQYDAIKQRLADKKLEIETCIKTNEPAASKDVINAQQSETDLDAKVGQIKNDIAKIMEEIAPYEVKTMLFNGDIIGLNRDIQTINDEIIALNKIKEETRVKIDEINKIIKELDKTILELETKIYSNVVVNNKNLLNLSEYTDTSLNFLFSYLNKKKLSSDVIYDKIEHRDIEHEKLYNRNKIFDILFYCFYFSFLLIMICTQNTKRENFLIYLFIGLTPFIYPFVFKWTLFLIKYLSNDPHGPKKAFVDINNTLIAYNN